jgi:hypothetical protein
MPIKSLKRLKERLFVLSCEVHWAISVSFPGIPSHPPIVSWHPSSKIMLFFLPTWQGDRQWSPESSHEDLFPESNPINEQISLETQLNQHQRRQKTRGSWVTPRQWESKSDTEILSSKNISHQNKQTSRHVHHWWADVSKWDYIPRRLH